MHVPPGNTALLLHRLPVMYCLQRLKLQLVQEKICYAVAATA